MRSKTKMWLWCGCAAIALIAAWWCVGGVFLKKNAYKEEVVAEYEIGQKYFNGDGVEKDFAKRSLSRCGVAIVREK